MLGKVRCFIVDVSHSDPHCGGASPGGFPFVNCHHNKLIQVVQPLIVQRPSGKNSPMRWDGEVWTECVIRQISVLPRVTVTGRHWGRDKRNKEGKKVKLCEEKTNPLWHLLLHTFSSSADWHKLYIADRYFMVKSDTAGRWRWTGNYTDNNVI